MPWCIDTWEERCSIIQKHRWRLILFDFAFWLLESDVFSSWCRCFTLLSWWSHSPYLRSHLLSDHSSLFVSCLITISLRQRRNTPCIFSSNLQVDWIILSLVSLRWTAPIWGYWFCSGRSFVLEITSLLVPLRLYTTGSWPTLRCLEFTNPYLWFCRLEKACNTNSWLFAWMLRLRAFKVLVALWGSQTTSW